MHTICRLLALLLLAITATATAQKTTLVVTGNVADFHPVHSNDLKEDPRLAFERELRRLKEENPDAVLVHAGRHLSIANGLETGYSYNHAKLFDELDFAAVNLDARDAALGTVGSLGYQNSPEAYRRALLTSLRTQHTRPMDVPAGRLAEPPAGLPLLFLSLSGAEAIAGLPGHLANLQPAPAGDFAALLAAAEAKKALRVGLSSQTAAAREATLGGSGKLDVLVDLTEPADAAVGLDGTTWHVPAPATGEILTVELEGTAGQLKQPKVTRSRFLAEAAVDGLYKFAVPQLGLPIPNLDEVMPQFFSAGSDAIQVDTVPSAPFTHLSSVTGMDLHIYHLKTQTEDKRIYRSFNRMPNWYAPGAQGIGWPLSDMLIVIGDGHRLEQVHTRNDFPVMGMDTTLKVALNRLAGKDPEEWTPDPQFAAGIPELWQWATGDIRRAIELDREIYGVGGLLYVDDNR